MASCSRSRSRSNGYLVFLTKLNGDKLSYKLPLTVRQLKDKLPSLAEDAMYKILSGTNALKNSQRLEGMDYHLSVVIVDIEMASWCPKTRFERILENECVGYLITEARSLRPNAIVGVYIRTLQRGFRGNISILSDQFQAKRFRI